MRTLSMITLVVLSLSSSALAAEGWNFRGRFLPNFNAAPQPGTAEASTTVDGPAAEPVPAEAVPAPAANAYGYPGNYGHGGNYGYGGFGGNGGNGGCSTCNGSGNGYFNFSWYGGCCEQQNSCCAGIWDNYCSQRKSWCNHHHKSHCCQQAPTCDAAPTCEAAPACNNGCGGHHGAWMNGGHFAHHYRSMMGGFGGNGCSNCGEGNGEMVYGKPAIGDEVPSEPAPVAEPTPAPVPAPRLQPKPAPQPPKPMAREAFRPYLPNFRMMPTSFGF